MDLVHHAETDLRLCLPEGDPRKEQFPELNLIQWCEQFVTPNSIFVDVGANLGLYSIVLSKKCKQVYSFEPRKLLYDCFTISICMNNRFNIVYEKTALGSREGEARLYQDPMCCYKATMREDRYTGTYESVQVKTLDSYKLKNVDFLHIDVGGYELEVIKGASLTLMDNNFPPFIFEAWNSEEFHQEKEAMVGFIRGLGYNVHPIAGYPNMMLASDNTLRQAPPSPKKVPKYNIDILVELYDKGKYDEIKSLNSDWINSTEGEGEVWEVWYTLANHYRNQSKHASSYDCVKRGLAAGPPEDKKYLFDEELSIICFYLQKQDEGYNASERIVLSHAPWSVRNYTLNNQAFYMSKLIFDNILEYEYPVPDGYIASSSSIVFNEAKDEFVMNLRSVNYSINNKGGYIIRDPKDIVRSRNFILKLDRNLKLKSGSTELKDTSNIPLFPQNILGLEDIRLINTSEFFCTYLEVNSSRTPQICYSQFDADGNVHTIRPLQITEELKCEKNWQPWYHNDELYFIYTIHPLRIYKLDRENGSVELIKETTLHDINLGEFRGSASPIPYRNGWLCTIHQVYYANPRKYFHRFVWFNEDWSQMKYTKVFYFEAREIEFNLSICHSPSGLLVPYSVKDNCCKIGILNYKILDIMLGFPPDFQ